MSASVLPPSLMPSTVRPGGRSSALPLIIPGLVVAAVAGLFAFQRVFDGDLWWHLATGRWVLETGRVPRADAFSFATAGAPWVAHSWLAAAAMTLLHRAGGIDALILGKVVIVAAGFALAWLLAVRAGSWPWVTALALCAVVPIAHSQFRERPQILMFLLVPIFYWLLEGEDAERRQSTWVALLLAMIAWANLHGSFFLGVALAGALAFDRAGQLGWALARHGPDRTSKPLWLSAGLVAALLAATVVNAYGPWLPLQIFRDFTHFAVVRTTTIEEHRALVLADNPAFLVLSGVTLLTLAVRGRRLRLYDLAAFGGFTWLAFSSERFTAIAAMLDACLLARNLTPLVERGGAALTARAQRLPRVIAPVLAGTIGLLGILGLGAAFRVSFAPGRETQWGLGLNEGRFPSAALRVLSDAGYAGNVFNSWELGGYLLWHLRASRDLVDGRALPAHFALLDSLARLDAPAFERWLDERDVGAALLVRRDPWLDWFSSSPRYALAASDDRSVLYVRTDVAARSGISLRRYRLIHPEQTDPAYLLPLAHGPDSGEAERELRRAAEADPGDFNALFQLGYFLEALGRPEAIDRYVAAAKLSPGMAFGHHDLGVRVGALALPAGRLVELEPFLRDALKVNAKSAPLETLIGTSLQLQKRATEAEASYHRALAIQEGYPVALKNLGFLLLEDRRPAEAIRPLQRAVVAYPDDESVAYGLAVALQQSGDAQGAGRAWRALLDRFPAGRWAPVARRALGGR